MNDISTWGQVIGLVMGGAGGLCWGVAKLITSMTASYASVIEELKKQNASQEARLQALTTGHGDCLKNHEECKKQVDALTDELAILRHEMDDLQKRLSAASRAMPKKK